MFWRQYCAIFREPTVPDQTCYTNDMDAKTGGSDHPLSLHDVSVADLIRNCELHEDGAVLAPKHVGAAIAL
jgi:hypothetical protein